MAERYRSTVDGGLPLSNKTTLQNAVLPMIAPLKRGVRAYLRRTDQTITVTFTGFPPEAVAHNMIGEVVDLPPWAVKAQQMLTY